MGRAFGGLDPRVPWVSATFFLFLAARLSVLTFVTIYLVRERDLAAALVGVAFLIENVTRAVAAPFAGALSDRAGRVPLMAGSALLTAALVPALLLIDDPVELIAWSIAIGLTQGPFFAVGTALLLDLVPADRRQRALALNYSVLSAGYTLGVAPAGFLAERGFAHLALTSSLGFISVATILVARLRGIPRPVAPAGDAAFLTRSVAAFRDRAFVTLAIFAFVLPMGLGLISLALPLYAADAGVSQPEIGLALALNGVIVALLAVPANTLLEARGPFRSLPLAPVALAAAYVVLVGSPGLVGAVAAVAVFSLGEIVFSAALPSAVAALAPPGLRGSYQGAWSMAFGLAVGSAFFLAGTGRDTIGWPATWLAIALATVLAGAGLGLASARLARISVRRAGTG